RSSCGGTWPSAGAAGSGSSANTSFSCFNTASTLSAVGANASAGSGGASVALPVLDFFFVVTTPSLRSHWNRTRREHHLRRNGASSGGPAPAPLRSLLLLGGAGRLRGAALRPGLAHLLLRRHERRRLALALAAVRLLRHRHLQSRLLDHLGDRVGRLGADRQPVLDAF